MKLDSRSKIHLEWMFENQPALVKHYLDSNNLAGLEKLLNRKLQSALNLVQRLKKDGMSEHEAFEVATQAILAPSDGPAFSDNPPDPLPYEEQRRVYARLEAREFGNRKAEERRSKMHFA